MSQFQMFALSSVFTILNLGHLEVGSHSHSRKQKMVEIVYCQTQTYSNNLYSYTIYKATPIKLKTPKFSFSQQGGVRSAKISLEVSLCSPAVWDVTASSLLPLAVVFFFSVFGAGSHSTADLKVFCLY
ncbi:hypothetical protein M758_5G129200 [Ceratodon purpureus]|nr:hypothetical protein M758_5G129200 [Ceratodon purpureus]